MAENQDDFAYAEFFAPETWPEKIPRTGTRITTAENRLGHRPIGTYDLPRWVKHPDVQKPVMQLHPEDYMGNKKSFNAAGWNVAHVGAQCSMFTGEGIRMLSKATKDEINAPDLAEGWTPLHWAVLSDNPKAAIWLLQHGANEDLQDFHGRTAADLIDMNLGDFYQRYWQVLSPGQKEPLPDPAKVWSRKQKQMKDAFKKTWVGTDFDIPGYADIET
mmetsp:Transcript_28369/g.65601  ORF Transcript_28369/g.65601 Transcript_28369/m.65601 type:complete len:217 (+) Transcript_28369:107-757(+)